MKPIHVLLFVVAGLITGCASNCETCSSPQSEDQLRKREIQNQSVGSYRGAP